MTMRVRNILNGLSAIAGLCSILPLSAAPEGNTSTGVGGAVVTTNPTTLHAEDLRCEYLCDPTGIDTQLPRFSWKLVEDAERADLLYRCLNRLEEPGYGYFIKRGETTWPMTQSKRVQDKKVKERRNVFAVRMK